MDKIYRVIKGNEFLETNELVFFDDNNDIITSKGNRIDGNTIIKEGLLFKGAPGYMIERNSSSTRIILAPQGSGKVYKENLNIIPGLHFKKLILHDNITGQDFHVRTHAHYIIFFNQVSACAFEFVGDEYKWEDGRSAFRLYPTEEYDKTWSLIAEK